MIYLHKILPLFVSPIALVIYILIASLFIQRLWPRILAIVLLLIFCNPIIGNFAIGYLEKDYPAIALEDVPNVDAVVVLGGMMRTDGGGNG